MVPKGLSIFDMNVTSKGLSWVDHMYQKFEAICVEVDKNPSLIIQETTKYVENQVTVVGANMRKFCAEVIQDILPPAPEVAIKTLASTMSFELAEEFGLSEKLKPDLGIFHTANVKPDLGKFETVNVKPEDPQKLSKGLPCARQESDCAFTFPDKLQETPPVHQAQAAEFSSSDIPKQFSASSIQEEIASEDSTSSNDAKLQPISLHSDANAYSDLPQDALHLLEIDCAVAVGQAKLKGMPLADESDHKRNGGVGMLGGVEVEDDPIPADVGSGGIGKLEMDNLEENGDCQESVEELELDDEVSPFVESHYADPPSLSKDESGHDVLVVREDENEESAFWYGNEEAQKQYVINVSTSNYFLKDVDVYKCQSVEKCDLDWEIL